MRKKDLVGSLKDVEILNYRILKQKSRSDGESVCLCMMEQGSNAVLVARLNIEGHIIDSQVFVWTDDTKNKVMKYASAYYKDLQDRLITRKI